MIITTTYLNKKTERGLICTDKAIIPALYLLGIQTFDNTKKIISYIPDRFTTIKEYTIESFLYYFYQIRPKNYFRLPHLNVPSMNRKWSYIIKIIQPEVSETIKTFNTQVKEFIEEYPNFIKNPDSCYKRRLIPKRSGGLRKVHEPNEKLKRLQKTAALILQKTYHILEHNAAHAYVKNRDYVTNGQMHKYANHIVVIDFKDFFPSINKDFLKTALYSIDNFGILNVPKEVLEESICAISKDKNCINEYYSLTKEFVDNVILIGSIKIGLPQGSPLSPLLCNLAMLQLDQQIVGTIINNKTIADNKLMYTRYADDMTFSTFCPINLKNLLSSLESLLQNTPLKINPTKTKYLRPTSRCFVTGVKINKDHETTYGHEKKALLKRELFKLFMAKKQGENIREDAQVILGKAAAAMRLEPTAIQIIINNYATKFHINPKEIYKYFK